MAQWPSEEIYSRIPPLIALARIRVNLMDET